MASRIIDDGDLDGEPEYELPSFPGVRCGCSSDGPAGADRAGSSESGPATRPTPGPRPWLCATARSRPSAPAPESSGFAGRRTRVIDRPDVFAIPGLIDATATWSRSAPAQEQLDLRGVASLEEVARRVKELAEASPAGSWITGRNWDQSLWPGRQFPDRRGARPGRPRSPVWLKRVDGHAGWANSEAMRLAKVDKDTKAPPGGQIIRDSAGDPTGVFIDGAMSLVGRAVPVTGQGRHQTQAAGGPAARSGTGLDLGARRRDLATASPKPIASSIARAGSVVRIYGMASLPAGGEVELREPCGRRYRLAQKAGSSCGRSSFTSTARWARAVPFCLSLTTMIRKTPGCC